MIINKFIIKNFPRFPKRSEVNVHGRHRGLGRSETDEDSAAEGGGEEEKRENSDQKIFKSIRHNFRQWDHYRTSLPLWSMVGNDILIITSLMLTRRDYKGLTWIDLESPTEQELTATATEYKIHPLVVGELTQASQRSKVDLYSEFIYLILHFPICQIYYGQQAEGSPDTEEIDFVIGRDFLITPHYQPIVGIGEFAASFNPSHPEDRGKDKTQAGLLFYHLVRHLYGGLATGLDYINGVLKQAERKVFANQERAMVTLLAEVNRNLLDFRWALKHHREVLDSLQSASREFFDDGFHHYLGAVISEYNRIWAMLENNRETFVDLRETNESLLSIKTNETMKVFTVVAVIFFPLTLVTQFWGMNMTLPFADSPYSYYFVLALMLASLFSMLVLAKYRRWL